MSLQSILEMSVQFDIIAVIIKYTIKLKLKLPFIFAFSLYSLIILRKQFFSVIYIIEIKKIRKRFKN